MHSLIPGKKAPRIITEEMVLSMKPGSIICDLAASQGGNSAFSEPDKVVEKNGIKIIGYTNLHQEFQKQHLICWLKIL